MTGGSDKRPPTLCNCYCSLTGPFVNKKYAIVFHFRGFNRTTPGSAPAIGLGTVSAFDWVALRSITFLGYALMSDKC